MDSAEHDHEHTHDHGDQEAAHGHDHHHGHEAGHKHSHGHSHGQAAGARLFWVILLNLGITIVEYVAGMLSGSLALISDAGHNLSDTLSLMLGYAGQKLSETSPSPRRSFGLRRVEVVIALVNGLTLVGIGAYILVESIDRFESPQPIDAWVLLPVAVVGLFANLFSMLILKEHHGHNLNLRAAFLHLLFDTLSSVAVVAVGIVLIFWPVYWLDLAAGLLIMVMIVYSSLPIILDSLRVILQIAPRHLDPQEIARALEAVQGVKGVHGLHIWSVSSNEVFLSCHLCKTNHEIASDDLIRRSNAMLKENFGIAHTTLQVELSRQQAHPGCDSCCH